MNDNIRYCMDVAKRYKAGEFEKYVDEMGWAHWMDEYITEDGDDVSLDDMLNITDIQRQGWNLVHDDDPISYDYIKASIDKYR